MNKNLVILILCLMAVITLEAQNYSNYVSVSNSAAVSTQLIDVRYEFVQSSANSSLAFFVDKYTGKVWKYRILKKEFEEIMNETDEQVDTTQVNYQLYMSGENSHMCFLLNVHTGQMWRYSTKEGNKKFLKMSMPWQK